MGLKHQCYSKITYEHYGTSLIKRSIVLGPHFSGLQFTLWSALVVREFRFAVYPLVGPQVRTLPQPTEPLYFSVDDSKISS